MGVSLLILACQYQPDTILNRILSHPVFVPLANTSYGCYLFNMIPIVALYLWFGVPYVWKVGLEKNINTKLLTRRQN